MKNKFQKILLTTTSEKNYNKFLNKGTTEKKFGLKIFFKKFRIKFLNQKATPRAF